MLSSVVYGWLEETHTCSLHILQIESLHLKASYCLLADPAKLQPASLDKRLSWGVAHWEQMVPWETDGLKTGNFQELLWEMGSHPLLQKPILKAQ